MSKTKRDQRGKNIVGELSHSGYISISYNGKIRQEAGGESYGRPDGKHSMKVDTSRMRRVANKRSLTTDMREYYDSLSDAQEEMLLLDRQEAEWQMWEEMEYYSDSEIEDQRREDREREDQLWRELYEEDQFSYYGMDEYA